MAVSAAFVALPVSGQSALTSAGADLSAVARPTAITGLASSARHCVSGDGANVHTLGWAQAGTTYAVTFDADVALVAAVNILDLNAKVSASGYGTPELRVSASTSGTSTLYVSGNGQSGCYRYKVEIGLPAGASTVADRAMTMLEAAPLARLRPLAITGLASSASHCVTGSYVANVHEIGRVEQGSQVTISFESSIDLVAGATNLNLQTQRGTYVTNDDSGGSRQPLLNFLPSQSGTLALHVAAVAGASGCYRYKVEIR